MGIIKTNEQRKIGVILSYLSQAIQILSGILYTPIMLRLLGQSEYGLYQLVFSTVSYLSLLSFGFSGAYIRYYSRFKAKNDEDGIARLNGMFLTIFMVLAAVCLICGVVMLTEIEMIFGSGLTAAEYETAKVLMLLMIFNVALTFPNSVFDSFTSAHESFVFQKFLLVMQNLLNPFITLPLLILGYGSVAMVVVTTGLTCAKLISNIWFCRKKLKVRFAFRQFDFGLLKDMWVFTFFLFLNMIIDQVNWSIGKFLLGRYAGTVAVAIYGVGAQLNSMYLQLSTTVSNVFVPKVNRIVAESDDNRQLTELFTRVGRIQFIILALIISGFIFFGFPFIGYWAGEGYDNAYPIALLLMIPVTIPLIQNLGIEIQRAKNMHKARSVVYLLIAVGNVLVSIPCIKLMGEIGAAVGTAISLLAGNGLFMNWYYHKKIKIDIIYFWKSILKFVPALILPIFVGLGLMIFREINSFIDLGICIVIYGLVYCVSMYFLGFNAEEKALVEKPLRKIAGKFLKRG